MAFRHVEALDIADMEPVPWAVAGMPGGIGIRVLGDDPDTGAVTAVLDIPAGWSSPDCACVSEEEFFVLRGDLVRQDHELKAGGFSFYPAGEPQGAWRSKSGCQILARFLTTPAYAPASGSRNLHPDAIPVLNTWAQQWVDPLVASEPSEAFRAGVMVKMLRLNKETGATTHLAGLMPGWFMPGQEVHPCVEENYCLSGDVHIGDIGGEPGYTMTPGMYMARPAGIAHGPILSKNGNVNLVWAHARLEIDYQHDPKNDRMVWDHLENFKWM